VGVIDACASVCYTGILNGKNSSIETQRSRDQAARDVCVLCLARILGLVLLWSSFLLLGATNGWHTVFLIVAYFNDLVCTQMDTSSPWRWFGYHWTWFGSGPRWERWYFGFLLD
jgi:hypothetical protein